MKVNTLLLLLYLVFSNAGYAYADDGPSLFYQDSNDLHLFLADPDNQNDDHTLFIPVSGELFAGTAPLFVAPQAKLPAEISPVFWHTCYIRGPPSLKQFTAS